MSGIRVMGRDETTWGRESKGKDTKKSNIKLLKRGGPAVRNNKQELQRVCRIMQAKGTVFQGESGPLCQMLLRARITQTCLLDLATLK